VDTSGFELLRDRTKSESKDLEAKSKLQTRIDLVQEIQDWIVAWFADEPACTTVKHIVTIISA